MANLAISGKSRRPVVGIVGVVVVVEVTGDTGRRQIREISIYMAGGASQRSVLAGERKSGFRVVEGGRYPAASRVTNRTIGGETGRLVVRVVRPVVVIDVT